MAISLLLRTMLAQFLVGCSSVRRKAHTKVMEGATNARSMGSELNTASNRRWDGVFRGKFGVDVGGVLNIHYRDLPRGTEWWTDAKYAAPDAMEGLTRIIEIFGPENVFLVSRADDNTNTTLTRGQGHANTWFSKLDIFQKTGLLEKNVLFTEFDENVGGKGVVASELGLTYFIDDTWTCIDSVFTDISYTVGNAREYIERENGLLNFFQRSGKGTELPECPDHLPQGILPYLKRVVSWNDALSLIEANVGMAPLTDPSIDIGCWRETYYGSSSVYIGSDDEEQMYKTWGWDGKFRGKFGVDVGGVLNVHYRDLPRGTEWWTDAKYALPDAMEGLTRIIEIFGPENVFIVSRADDNTNTTLTRGQGHANTWFSKLDIFQKTGLLKKNVLFTKSDEKKCGKGEAASELGLTHFIDDTWTCIDSVFNDNSYTVGNARKYIEKQNGLLIFFQRSGLGTELPECPDHLPQGMDPYLKRATKWKDALSLIEANVGMAPLTDPCIDIGCGRGKQLPLLVDVCCCRKERCNQNQHSHDQRLTMFRAIESVGEDQSRQCCIRSNSACDELVSNSTGLRWAPKADSYCENKFEKAISEAIEQIPDPACRGQLTEFTKLVTKKVTKYKNRMFHGTEIHDIHDAHAAETITYRMLLEGARFHEGSSGGSFFKHAQPVKMLWNEVDKDARKAWKKELNAGELSRDDDTIFGEIVEDSRVGQLRKCDYDAVDVVRNVWGISSLSYAGVAPEGRLVMLIGKNDRAGLEKTMLWKAELHGVAASPPLSGISVISLGDLHCSELMKIIKERLESLTRHDPSFSTIKKKWESSQSFTCRMADRSKPDQKAGDMYMPPFGEGNYGPDHWRDLAKQGGGRVFFSEYSKEDCIQLWLSMDSSACHHFKSFREIMAFESDDKALKEFVHGCPNLKSIDLSDTSASDFGIKAVTKSCNHLETISLQSSKITDIGVQDLAQSCPHLREINLVHTEITDTGIKDLARGRPELRSINLAGCKGITDNGVEEIARHCPKMKNINFRETAVSSTGLAKIANGCPDLTHMHFPPSATTEDVKKIVHKLKGVNLLTASTAGTHLSDDAHKELVWNTPGNITSIDLKGMNIGDETIKELAFKCKGINLLTAVFDQGRVSDKGYKYLAKNMPDDTTSVDLIGKEIGDETIEELAFKCKRINLLTAVFDQGRVSDNGYKALAKNMPDDTTLIDLGGKRRLGDETIEAIALNCKKLEEIDLSKTGVTLIGVNHLEERCPLLRAIHLSETNINYKSFRETLGDLSASVASVAVYVGDTLMHTEDLSSTGRLELDLEAPPLDIDAKQGNRDKLFDVANVKEIKMKWNKGDMVDVA